MRARLFFILSVALSASAVVLAQTRTFEKFQVTDTEVGIASATLQPSGQIPVAKCEGRLETASVRYRFDLGTVGSTTGLLLEVGDVLAIDDPVSAANLRMVKTGSTTAVFQVSCWR